MVSQNKCSLEPTNRTDVPNKCSHRQAITYGYRTNVRLRQDPIPVQKYVNRTNVRLPTLPPISYHMRDRKTRAATGSGTRAEPAADPEPDAEHAEPDARGKPADHHRNRMHAAAPSTPTRSGTMKRGNAAQANIMPLESILYASWYLYSLTCRNCLESANNRT